MDICCVCGTSNSSNKNPILKCAGKKCGITVHKVCYGIGETSKSWTCTQCVSRRGHEQVCVLCPLKEGAMKCMTDGERWCHIVCALFHPCVRIGDRHSIDKIYLLSEASPSNDICFLCSRLGKELESKQGRCIQCKSPGCDQKFHVTCGQLAGLLVNLQLAKGVNFQAFCDAHSRKTRTRGFHVPDDFADIPDARDSVPFVRSISQDSSNKTSPSKMRVSSSSNSITDSAPSSEFITPLKASRISRKENNSGNMESDATEEKPCVLEKEVDLPEGDSTAELKEENVVNNSLQCSFNDTEGEDIERIRGDGPASENTKCLSSQHRLLANNSPPNLSPQPRSPSAGFPPVDEDEEEQRLAHFLSPQEHQQDTHEEPRKVPPSQPLTRLPPAQALMPVKKRIRQPKKVKPEMPLSHNGKAVKRSSTGVTKIHTDTTSQMASCSSAPNPPLTMVPPPQGLKIRGWNGTPSGCRAMEDVLPEVALDPAYKGMETLLEWQWDQASVLCMQLTGDSARNAGPSNSNKSDLIDLLNCLHNVKRENEGLVQVVLDMEAKTRILDQKNEKLHQLLAGMSVDNSSNTVAHVPHSTNNTSIPNGTHSHPLIPTSRVTAGTGNHIKVPASLSGAALPTLQTQPRLLTNGTHAVYHPPSVVNNVMANNVAPVMSGSQGVNLSRPLLTASHPLAPQQHRTLSAKTSAAASWHPPPQGLVAFPHPASSTAHSLSNSGTLPKPNYP